MLFYSLFRLHVYHDRVGGEGGCLENTIRMNLPKGLLVPLGFGEICGNFWDFRRSVPEHTFILLLLEPSIACLPYLASIDIEVARLDCSIIIGSFILTIEHK